MWPLLYLCENVPLLSVQTSSGSVGAVLSEHWRIRDDSIILQWPLTCGHWWLSEQILSGTSADVGYTVPFIWVYAGK